MEPEQRLFLNVIIQLIEDYASDTTPALIRLQALAWFKSNSMDFKEVCDNAGIDSTWLRAKVLSSKPSDLQRLLNEFRKFI